MKLSRRSFIRLVVGAVTATIVGVKTRLDEVRSSGWELVIGHGQSRRITAYDETTRVATIDPAWDLSSREDSIYTILLTSVGEEIS